MIGIAFKTTRRPCATTARQQPSAIMPVAITWQLANRASNQNGEGGSYWSAHDLAAKTGLSYGAIQKAELAENDIPNMLAKNLTAIKTALEKGGVQFIDAGPYSGEASHEPVAAPEDGRQNETALTKSRGCEGEYAVHIPHGRCSSALGPVTGPPPRILV